MPEKVDLKFFLVTWLKFIAGSLLFIVLLGICLTLLFALYTLLISLMGKAAGIFIPTFLIITAIGAWLEIKAGMDHEG